MSRSLPAEEPDLLAHPGYGVPAQPPYFDSINSARGGR
jgi:hypothetical protein